MTGPARPDFERVTFLIQNLLEEGVFAFMTGNPGATKTLVTLELAARLTRGKSPGDRSRQPINVLYISIESDFKRSTGPRFEAAGGDFARFRQIEDVIWLPSQIDRLRQVIRQFKAKLCIIDPIKDHLDPNVYSSPTLTTQALRQIQVVARTTDCAIVGIDWPSKATRKGDLSVSGNAAFTGVPRQVIAVGQLSRDEFVIGVSKANDSASLTGWIYRHESVDVRHDVHNRMVTARKITWIRSAKPSEVLSAREQAKIMEDTNLIALLQFVSNGEEFKTDDLVSYLNSVQLIGKNKARSLLTSAKDAGFLIQRSTGGGADYSVTWAISPVGQLRLAASEEAVEEAIETLFPSMDPLTANNGQRMLPRPKPRKRLVRQVNDV